MKKISPIVPRDLLINFYLYENQIITKLKIFRYLFRLILNYKKSVFYSKLFSVDYVCLRKFARALKY